MLSFGPFQLVNQGIDSFLISALVELVFWFLKKEESLKNNLFTISLTEFLNLVFCAYLIESKRFSPSMVFFFLCHLFSW